MQTSERRSAQSRALWNDSCANSSDSCANSSDSSANPSGMTAVLTQVSHNTCILDLEPNIVICTIFL